MNEKTIENFTIHKAANGYILIPDESYNKAISYKSELVFESLDSLLDWISENFKERA